MGGESLRGLDLKVEGLSRAVGVLFGPLGAGLAENRPFLGEEKKEENVGLVDAVVLRMVVPRLKDCQETRGYLEKVRQYNESRVSEAQRVKR